MPVRIRLQRFGRRNLPFYRIVVADSRAPRDGRFIEKLGTYNPLPSRDGIKEITAHGDRGVIGWQMERSLRNVWHGYLGNVG